MGIQQNTGGVDGPDEHDEAPPPATLELLRRPSGGGAGAGGGGDGWAPWRHGERRADPLVERVFVVASHLYGGGDGALSPGVALLAARLWEAELRGGGLSGDFLLGWLERARPDRTGPGGRAARALGLSEPQAERLARSGGPDSLAEALWREDVFAACFRRVASVHERVGAARPIWGRDLLGALLAPAPPDGGDGEIDAAAHLAGLGYDLDELRHDFYRWVTTPGREPEQAEAWARLLLGAPAAALVAGAVRARYSGDGVEGEDELGITRDVNALASVLASADLEPPLAVGLFGDWGAGKSFFLRRLEDRIAWLAGLRTAAGDGGAEGAGAGAPRSPYAANVVQIRFNAWHYLEANLWACLAEAIVHGLVARYVESAEMSPEEARAELATRAFEAQARRASLDAALAQKRAALAAQEKTLAEARTALEEKTAALRTTPYGPEAVLRAGLEEGVTQHRPAIEAALRRLGVASPAAGDGAEGAAEGAAVGGDSALGAAAERLFTAARAVVTAGSETRDLARALTRGSDRVWGWLGLGVALCLPLLVGAVVSVVSAPGGWLSVLERWHAVLLETLAGAAGVLWFLRGRLEKARDRLRALVERIEAQRQRKRREAEAKLLPLQQERDAAAAEVARAESERARVVSELERLEAQIAQTGRGWRTFRFLDARRQAGDYRRHLGIVSTIREDLEQLSRLLVPDRDEDGGLVRGDKPPIDRIVLYIDDLDRCPEKRVLEVLQAVHLLLAFPLFVVVVAVDPRWLKRSLESCFLALEAPREGAAGPAATGEAVASAQDYLEKIFQIPYTLGRIGDAGYRRLLWSLVATEIAPRDTPDAPASGGTAGHPAGRSGPSDPPGPSGVSPAGAGAADARGALAAEAREALAAAQLQLQAHEVETMKALGPLFDTPRAVKRFVNLYRILRATLRSADLAAFVGCPDQPGQYVAVQVLLAIVTGAAEKSRAVVGRLLADGPDGPDGPDGTPWTGRLAADDPRLARRIARTRDQLAEPERAALEGVPLAVVRRWALHVARYSFQPGLHDELAA
jgi:hypothetical protein